MELLLICWQRLIGRCCLLLQVFLAISKVSTRLVGINDNGGQAMALTGCSTMLAVAAVLLLIFGMWSTQ